MRSHFEALEVRTSTCISWEEYKSTHNTCLGKNEPREHKRGWKGTENHSAVKGLEAQEVLKWIAPGLEQRSNCAGDATANLHMLSSPAAGLGGTICPRKGRRVISSDLQKGALQASSCSEGQNPPRFHHCPTCQLSRRDPQSNWKGTHAWWQQWLPKIHPLRDAVNISPARCTPWSQSRRAGAGDKPRLWLLNSALQRSHSSLEKWCLQAQMEKWIC